MTRYAAGTTVSSERSRAEIENILIRYGASGFAYGWDGPRAIVMFQMSKRRIKFLIPLPNKEDFAKTPARGALREPTEAHRYWEQACRQRWRALALVIKAKLEAVESGITEFEEEFLAHIVLPDGKTVGEHARPSIALAYTTGKMPPLLPYHAEK